ncbi:hypothetical protein [Halorientalis regularis]|uniref:Uncharacterized protein n=1 Tax=Halorientalis regularis TaxID=660518 RepID=A0A1G7TX04_9EURY|nr:hypothetical protein [Halorientalis regularis]SDG39279.1 hypothetical protein SAMN05216218_1314 [Halorientalis regularis]
MLSSQLESTPDEFDTEGSLLQNLWFPISIGVLAFALAGVRGKVGSTELILAGLVLDITGAIVLATPDISLRNFVATPEELEEARDQLFEIGHMIRGEADENRMDALIEIIEKSWEGDIASEPHSIYVRKLYPDEPQRAVRIMYSEDAETPEERLFEGDFEDKGEAVFGGEDYDWIAQQTIFYQWVGNEITRTKKRIRHLQTQGAIILTFGFSLQLISVIGGGAEVLTRKR